MQVLKPRNRHLPSRVMPEPRRSRRAAIPTSKRPRTGLSASGVPAWRRPSLIRHFGLDPRTQCLTVAAAWLLSFLTLPVGASPAIGDEPANHQNQNRNPSAKSIDQPLVTDRPDFTESTDAVPTGRLQLEMGYTFTYSREKGERVRTHIAPEALLRIGLVENLELRIGWDGYNWSDRTGSANRSDDAPSDRGSSQAGHDVSLGIKYKFFEQDDWWPHLGVIAGVTVPSGSAALSSGDVDPELVLLWAYDVTDRFAIAGNVGLHAPTEDSSRFFQATASLSFAYSLTDRFGTYVEYFGLYPNTRHTDCAHTIATGLTYLVTNDFQLDWRIGAGINEEADDFFTGVGFAWRW
jgi:hypothetical protein